MRIGFTSALPRWWTVTFNINPTAILSRSIVSQTCASFPSGDKNLSTTESWAYEYLNEKQITKVALLSISARTDALAHFSVGLCTTVVKMTPICLRSDGVDLVILSNYLRIELNSMRSFLLTVTHPRLETDCCCS